MAEAVDNMSTIALVVTVILIAVDITIRIVALFVLQFYADEIVRAVEARHYPHAAKVAGLPFRWRFYRSGLYISPLAPLILGTLVGILTMLMGVGGGFLLVPAMLYILGMSGNVVVGTSLFQILFVTMATTMMHAMTTKAVDLVLAMLLLIGSVTGAQVGTRLSMTIRPEYLRVLLALIVLLVAARMALGLGWRPDEIFTIELN